MFLIFEGQRSLSNDWLMHIVIKSAQSSSIASPAFLFNSTILPAAAMALVIRSKSSPVSVVREVILTLQSLPILHPLPPSPVYWICLLPLINWSLALSTFLLILFSNFSLSCTALGHVFELDSCAPAQLTHLGVLRLQSFFMCGPVHLPHFGSMALHWPL